MTQQLTQELTQESVESLTEEQISQLTQTDINKLAYGTPGMFYLPIGTAVSETIGYLARTDPQTGDMTGIGDDPIIRRTAGLLFRAAQPVMRAYYSDLVFDLERLTLCLKERHDKLSFSFHWGVRDTGTNFSPETDTKTETEMWMQSCSHRYKVTVAVQPERYDAVLVTMERVE